MKTIVISEEEYNQMQQALETMRAQLAALQDEDFLKKLALLLQSAGIRGQGTITYLPVSPPTMPHPTESPFGMWADRDIDQTTLRRKAWQI